MPILKASMNAVPNCLCPPFQVQQPYSPDNRLSQSSSLVRFRGRVPKLVEFSCSLIPLLLLPFLYFSLSHTSSLDALSAISWVCLAYPLTFSIPSAGEEAKREINSFHKAVAMAHKKLQEQFDKAPARHCFSPHRSLTVVASRVKREDSLG